MTTTTTSLIGPRRIVALSDLVLEHKLFHNPRTHTGMGAELEDLAASIKKEGMLDPPKVIRVKGPNSTVIDLVWDGQRRVLANRMAFGKVHQIEVMDTMAEPVELTPELADDLMGKALAIGGKRAGLSSFELSEVASRMRDRDATLAKIADKLDKSESWVSKILAARMRATPKLMASWQRGDITDEQFKELAAEREPEKQDTATSKVVETRKSGDKAEARTVAKEIKETAAEKAKRAKAEKAQRKADAKAAKQAAKDAKVAAKAQKKADALARKNGKKNGVPPVVGGPQVPLAFVAPTTTKDAKAEAPKPAKKSAPSKTALEDIASLRHSRPPTHDYCKGVIHGVMVGLGDIQLHELLKPWAAYISRVGGSAKPTPSGKARAPKVKRVMRAKRPLKTKGKPKAGKRKR